MPQSGADPGKLEVYGPWGWRWRSVADANAERDDEIFALASSGVAHSSIAARFEISRARVGQIVNARTPAVFGFTDAHRAAVRHQEAEVLKRLAKAAERVVNDPPPRSSAIGKVVTYPDGHPRAGEIVTDESVRVAAIRERRLISESYRRLTGTDLAHSDRTMPKDQAEREMWAAIAERRAELKQLAAAAAPIVRGELVMMPNGSDGARLG